MFNMYPYNDFHEMNLDWVIKKIKELGQAFNVFEAVNKITNAGAWDITKQYQAWTIVSDNNIGYISLKPVPAGVAITNTAYWGLVADYDILITNLSQRISDLENTTLKKNGPVIYYTSQYNGDLDAIFDSVQSNFILYVDCDSVMLNSHDLTYAVIIGSRLCKMKLDAALRIDQCVIDGPMIDGSDNSGVLLELGFGTNVNAHNIIRNVYFINAKTAIKSTFEVDTSIISGCFMFGGDSFVDIQTSGSYPPSAGVVIENNHVSGLSGVGIKVTRFDSLTIKNNIVNNCGVHESEIFNVWGLDYTNNHHEDHRAIPKSEGVLLASVTSGCVLGNVLDGYTVSGINVSSAAEMTLDDNILYNITPVNYAVTANVKNCFINASFTGNAALNYIKGIRSNNDDAITSSTTLTVTDPNTDPLFYYVAGSGIVITVNYTTIPEKVPIYLSSKDPFTVNVTLSSVATFSNIRGAMIYRIGTRIYVI